MIIEIPSVHYADLERRAAAAAKAPLRAAIRRPKPRDELLAVREAGNVSRALEAYDGIDSIRHPD